MSNWAFQDAKAHLSELVKRAQDQGPQYITVRGNPAVVVISQKKYKALMNVTGSLVDLFRNSPLVGSEIDLKRDESSIAQE